MAKRVLPVLVFPLLVLLLSGCPSETGGGEASIFGTWTSASVTWEIGTLTDVVITLNSDGVFSLVGVGFSDEERVKEVEEEVEFAVVGVVEEFV